jgi:hypothetical protein
MSQEPPGDEDFLFRHQLRSHTLTKVTENSHEGKKYGKCPY